MKDLIAVLCAKCRDDLLAAGYTLEEADQAANRIICGVCGRQTWGRAYRVAKGGKGEKK